MAPSSTRMRSDASARSSASTGEITAVDVDTDIVVTHSSIGLVPRRSSRARPEYFSRRRCSRTAARDIPKLRGFLFEPYLVLFVQHADHHRVPRSLARRDTRIDNESIDRCLAAKLPAIKTPVAQTNPKHTLGIGLITPETSGNADVPFHRTHLPSDV